MKLYPDSLVNLGLVLCLWLCVAFSCNSTQPAQDRQADIEAGKYVSSELAYCGEKLRAGYLVRGGEKIPFECDEPNFRHQRQQPTPEEEARGVNWKYETWFEPTRYRVVEGGRWSAWKAPQQGERMGRAALTLEAGEWIVKPISDEFTKADCAEFKKIPE
jgi:hypothetical protein